TVCDPDEFWAERRDALSARVSGKQNVANAERGRAGVRDGDADGRAGAGAVGVSSLGELSLGGGAGHGAAGRRAGGKGGSTGAVYRAHQEGPLGRDWVAHRAGAEGNDGTGAAARRGFREGAHRRPD